MNDAIATADVGAPPVGANDEITLEGQSRFALYFAVGLGAGGRDLPRGGGWPH